MKKRISSYALPILVLLIVWICQLLYGAALLFSKPLVTVIMPTYNRADLLPRAIESVLKQTFRDFELIIVDDGSTDGSVDLIRSYMEKDKRIFLIVNNQNKGISYSRNRAYNAARGKYIMPMDSDDQILPNKLLVQTTFLENHPDIDLVGSYARPFHNLNTLFQTDTGSKTVDLLFGNPFGHIETLMRKSFLDKHKIRYDESFIAAVDYDLYAPILRKIPLVPFATMSYALFLTAFIALILTLCFPSFIAGLMTLILMCLAIGTQLAFSIGNIARLHRIATPALRSTISSTNTMVGRLFSTLCLMSLKLLPDKNILTAADFQTAFLIFALLFALVGAPLLYRMTSHQTSFGT